MQTRAATETNKRNSERKFDVESAKIPNAAPGFLACTRFAKPGMISIPRCSGIKVVTRYFVTWSAIITTSAMMMSIRNLLLPAMGDLLVKDAQTNLQSRRQHGLGRGAPRVCAQGVGRHTGLPLPTFNVTAVACESMPATLCYSPALMPDSLRTPAHLRQTSG